MTGERAWRSRAGKMRRTEGLVRRMAARRMAVKRMAVKRITPSRKKQNQDNTEELGFQYADHVLPRDPGRSLKLV